VAPSHGEIVARQRPRRIACRIDPHWNFRWGIEVFRQRFLARVEKTHCCWLWTGGRSNKGYGMVWFNGHNVAAHRVAYILFVGEIEPEMEIDHTCANRRCGCDNRLCVRWTDHLEPVTGIENKWRAPSFGAYKTHCLRGHEYTPENTITKQSGGRNCRECMRAHWNRYDRERRRRPVGVVIHA